MAQSRLGQNAILVPIGTDDERPSSPEAGEIRFNTDLETFEGYDGTEWGAIGGGADLAGQVSFFAMDTAPDGWLKANGAEVSRSTYSDLFDAIGTTFGSGDGSSTFGLPDLRGEFMRGWDDGRGADDGRSFGTTQSDELKSHNHSGSTISGLDTSNLTGSALQTSSESFSDSDTVLMTAAAVNDRIESFGYSTTEGTVTSVSVSAGTGLSGGGTVTSSGTITLNVDLDEIGSSNSNSDGDSFVVINSADGSQHKLAKGSINLSGFNNDLGLGTTDDVEFDSLGIGTSASGTSGEIRATGDITAHFSDDRLKTRLGGIEDALEKVCSLDGFYYEPNDTAVELGYERDRQVGVSAQSVDNVLPEAVKPAPISDKYLTVQYEKLVPMLIEAIKELEARVAELELKE